jgi:hypothetical protein
VLGATKAHAIGQIERIAVIATLSDVTGEHAVLRRWIQSRWTPRLRRPKRSDNSGSELPWRIRRVADLLMFSQISPKQISGM